MFSLCFLSSSYDEEYLFRATFFDFDLFVVLRVVCRVSFSNPFIYFIFRLQVIWCDESHIPRVLFGCHFGTPSLDEVI